MLEITLIIVIWLIIITVVAFIIATVICAVFGNYKADKTQDSIDKVELINKIKEGNLTEEDFDFIAKGNEELISNKEFYSQFFSKI